MVHVLACTYTGMLDFLKETLDIEYTTNNMLGLLSNHTIARIMGRPESIENLEAATGLLHKTKGLFSHEILNFLVDALWRDRQQFFILCKNGSFPGVSLLFYMLWEQMNGLGITK